MTDPESARVFIVGRNPATEFPVEVVGSHEVFLDALFNRNGQSHEELYLRVRQDKGPSPTHTNTQALVAALNRTGINDVLATNVICYGTPMSADLAHARHRGGKARGKLIFKSLLRVVAPEVLIVHGAGSREDLDDELAVTLPPPPLSPDEPVSSLDVSLQADSKSKRVTIFVIQSLAPRAWNSWSTWAVPYFDVIARAVAKRLAPAA
jgi:hypothetical protein